MNVWDITAMVEAMVSGFSISKTESGFLRIVTQNRPKRLKNKDGLETSPVLGNKTRLCRKNTVYRNIKFREPLTKSVLS